MIFLIFVTQSCNLTKRVPEGKYLLKKNTIYVEGHSVDKGDLEDVVRQSPNRSSLGLKMRLWAYNQNRFFFFKSDSLTIAEVRERKNEKLHRKNAKRLERQDRINNKRMAQARKQNDSTYYEKIVRLRDTLEPKRFIREWFKYKFGEPPVIYDSSATVRTVQSMNNYMKKKGFFYSVVNFELDTTKRKRKISVLYTIETNNPYVIDSIKTFTDNKDVSLTFQKYLSEVRKNNDNRLRGNRLDSDVLNKSKEKIAKFYRDNGFYGFSANHISIAVDTTLGDYKAFVGITLGDRIIREGEETRKIPQQVKRIRDVYFHLADTTRYKGDFTKLLKEKHIDASKLRFLPTFDTLRYEKIKYSRANKRKMKLSQKIDTLNPKRMATFTFNRKMYIRPNILELQNYLEEGGFYKDYYTERSISHLMELGVFQVVRPELEELEGTNLIDVHYYLVPNKKQSFTFEPRFTNSNGFLGTAASVSYTNSNVFNGAERLTISFSGGFESMPPVISENLDGSNPEQHRRIFNTFEYGPTVKLELPGLFPVPAFLMTKRKNPTTIISVAYNKQHRPDFDRETFQMTYSYKFEISKMQLVQAGLPFASVIKFVSIDKKDYFEDKINETNDLFLRNAYSNQLIWEDFKLIYEFNNISSPTRKRLTMFFNATFNHAGATANFFSRGYNNNLGQKTIFGVAYSQFAKLDNEIIGAYNINKNQSVNFRLQVGGGLPYGNIATSLPYDYSFYAGGANDNRGWGARTLGPGKYKYYLDEKRTITQIGDIRLGGQLEYRIAATDMFKFGFFVDANNIWTLREDANRPGSQFTKDFYKEFAISAGAGLRLDFSFFIVRLDLGIPLTNPALPQNAKWIFQSRQPYYDEGLAQFGPDYKSKMPRPFRPIFNFGIGYPF